MFKIVGACPLYLASYSKIDSTNAEVNENSDRFTRVYKYSNQVGLQPLAAIYAPDPLSLHKTWKNDRAHNHQCLWAFQKPTSKMTNETSAIVHF
jgi:hypothetical protein